MRISRDIVKLASMALFVASCAHVKEVNHTLPTLQPQPTIPTSEFIATNPIELTPTIQIGPCSIIDGASDTCLLDISKFGTQQEVFDRNIDTLSSRLFDYERANQDLQKTWFFKSNNYILSPDCFGGYMHPDEILEMSITDYPDSEEYIVLHKGNNECVGLKVADIYPSDGSFGNIYTNPMHAAKVLLSIYSDNRFYFAPPDGQVLYKLTEDRDITPGQPVSTLQIYGLPSAKLRQDLFRDYLDAGNSYEQASKEANATFYSLLEEALLNTPNLSPSIN